MRVLVTGSTGLIGTHLIKRLKEWNTVISLVHNYVSCPSINEALIGTRIVEGDVTDVSLMRELVTRYEVTHIVHLAAIAKVKTAYLEPYSVYKTNMMGTLAILEAARNMKPTPKVLYMQTDKVYGEKLKAVESDPYVHSEPYATSKAAAGLMAKSYADTYKMNVVLAHSVNIFGYDPFSNRIVPNTIKDCVRSKNPLIYTNDTSLREYIYVKDLVKILEHFLVEERYTGSYNISTGIAMRQEELVKLILVMYPWLQARYEEAKLPPQIQEETMSSNRFQEWEPWTSMTLALQETADDFKKYQEEWDK